MLKYHEVKRKKVTSNPLENCQGNLKLCFFLCICFSLTYLHVKYSPRISITKKNEIQESSADPVSMAFHRRILHVPSTMIGNKKGEEDYVHILSKPHCQSPYLSTIISQKEQLNFEGANFEWYKSLPKTIEKIYNEVSPAMENLAHNKERIQLNEQYLREYHAKSEEERGHFKLPQRLLAGRTTEPIELNSENMKWKMFDVFPKALYPNFQLGIIEDDFHSRSLSSTVILPSSNYSRESRQIPQQDIFQNHLQQEQNITKYVKKFGDRSRGQHDGGKFVFGYESSEYQTPGCTLFSLGCNYNYLFERAFIKYTACNVEIFDCTVEDKVPNELRHRVRFHKICYSYKDLMDENHNKQTSENDESGQEEKKGTNWKEQLISELEKKSEESFKFMSLLEMMIYTGHDQITYLKADIEGYEWELFEELYEVWMNLDEHSSSTNIPAPQVKNLAYSNSIKDSKKNDKLPPLPRPTLPPQISVEVHSGTMLSSNSWHHRTRTVGELAFLAERLYEMGYRVLSREDNNWCAGASEIIFGKFACPTDLDVHL